MVMPSQQAQRCADPATTRAPDDGRGRVLTQILGSGLSGRTRGRRGTAITVPSSIRQSRRAFRLGVITASARCSHGRCRAGCDRGDHRMRVRRLERRCKGPGPGPSASVAVDVDAGSSDGRRAGRDDTSTPAGRPVAAVSELTGRNGVDTYSTSSARRPPWSAMANARREGERGARGRAPPVGTSRPQSCPLGRIAQACLGGDSTPAHDFALLASGCGKASSISPTSSPGLSDRRIERRRGDGGGQVLRQRASCF